MAGVVAVEPKKIRAERSGLFASVPKKMVLQPPLGNFAQSGRGKLS
jgi:hypothetical protein